ncbi:hypothetical protein PISMIDRAFT_608258 [Pisolithus microcarpus 441]|uniref:Uncharacterized protein n=1 Tax=Pisolithus microcarpus 441 TaxID=765257 RepID=A0A0D0A1B3_9AGAM|nr:hypothetical protein PISMIDRAFT_608258 [Pisolithus microcarpus 441]
MKQYPAKGTTARCSSISCRKKPLTVTIVGSLGLFGRRHEGDRGHRCSRTGGGNDVAMVLGGSYSARGVRGRRT